jgi:hypothetical protein
MRASDDPDCDGVAWKYVSEFQKSAEPNIALRLLDVILRQLKQGSTEPVLIASETLSNLDKLSGQRIMTKPHQLAMLVRPALRFAILMGQRA